MAEDQGERTEEATQGRRDEFRKRGQVAYSKELASTVYLLASALAIYVLSKFYFQHIYESFRFSFGIDMVASVRAGDILSAMSLAGEKILILLAPVFAISFIIAIGSQVIQTGFLQVEDVFTPKIEKINPIDGFGRLFSLKNLAEGIKALLKLIFIFSIVVMLIKSELISVPKLMQFSIQQQAEYLGDVTFRLFISIGIAMAVLSAADYFFQKWDLEKKNDDDQTRNQRRKQIPRR